MFIELFSHLLDWLRNSDDMRHFLVMKGPYKRSLHKAYFLSSPKTSKQSAFPLTEPLKCPLSWRNSSRKKRLWGPLFWNCPGSEAMWMWRNSVRLDKLAGRRKTNHRWHLSQGQQNLFFPSDYPLMVSWLSSMLLFPCLEYVWVKVIRLRAAVSQSCS